MKPPIRRRGLVYMVFLLCQVSALSVTLVCEGMGILGYLAFADVYASQNLAPSAGDPYSAALRTMR